MTDESTTPNTIEDAGSDDDHAGTATERTLTPLPGEAGIPNVATQAGRPMSLKGLLAVMLMIGGLVALCAFSIQRCTASGQDAVKAKDKHLGDQPSAAAVEPRRLDMAPPPASSAPRVPAIQPTVEDAADPIGVRRTGTTTTGTAPATVSPEDAPVVLVSSTTAAAKPASDSHRGSEAPSDPLDQTRHNLDAYQRQLQGLLDSLNQTGTLAANGIPAPPGGPAASSAAGSNAGLFGGQLQVSGTPRVSAGTLGNRSLTLPKGTAFTCALKTKVISATSGFVGCQVLRNVFSDDGRVLLVERGSHLDGEYRIASLRPGSVRIPVLWSRIRTPNGVTVDIDSPGTGPLGESGIDGYVDNRWGERIGAAMLLSVIDDAVKLVVQGQDSSQGTTVVLPSTAGNTSKLAEKVLDSTINIPPLIYQNQGGIVGIYVARDVDFWSVYALQVAPR
jgi:type IV secretion system protein VirB10